MAEAKDNKKLRFVLMTEHPLLGYALFFMIGAYAAIVYNIPMVVFFTLLAASVSVMITLTILRKKSRLVALIVFLSAGYLLCGSYLPDWYRQDYVPPEEIGIMGTVERVNNTDYSREYILEDVKLGSDEIESKIKVRNITQNNYVKTGDVIRLKVTLEKPAVAQRDGMFSEIRYYMTKDIQYTATVFDPKIVVVKEDTTAVSANEKWQDRIYTQMKEDFVQPVLGMIYSLSTGSKDYMDSEIYSKSADLGIAHIFAISGLHIGALLLLWEFYCKKTRKRFLVKILGSAFLIFVLYLVVGSRASLLRAIIMWALIVVYHYMGIKGKLIDILSIAIIGLIVMNPLYVIDLGFILSITCVGAIALIYVPISQKLKASKFFNFYPVSLFAVSIAIMCFSWIITARAFGQIAVMSPIWNVLFVPMIVVLMMLILCYAVLFFVPVASTAIVFVIDKLSGFIISMLTWCERFNFDISTPNISFAAAALIMIIFLLMTDVAIKGKRVLRILSGFGAIAVIVSLTIFYPKPEKIEIFAGYDAAFVYIYEEGQSVLILNDDDGGFKRVLRDIDANTIDKFIYSGNDIEELDELIADIEGITFKEIIVHKDLLEGYAGEYIYLPIDSNENIIVGDVKIHLDEFRANKKAVTHYYAAIDYYDKSFIYLDPLRLREGALDGSEIIISSRWTKQRIENLTFGDSKYVIMNARNYLMDDMPISQDNLTIPTYNINDSGSFTYFPEGEK